MTNTLRRQDMLRDFSHRLVQAQESESGRLALELTDNITQSLVVILFRLQTLVGKLPAQEWPSRGEMVKLSELLGQTADEVERISHNLRPNVLKNLGLVAALRAANKEFLKRTGMRIKLACVAEQVRGIMTSSKSAGVIGALLGMAARLNRADLAPIRSISI